MNTRFTLQIPNGVANPDQDTGYVVGLQGFIYCLDLTSGEVLARSEFPALPLTIDRDMLIGWAPGSSEKNTINLFGATRQGDVLRVKWEKPLSLPGWVEVDSAEVDGLSIAAEIQDKLSVVTWKARSQYKGGAHPPAFVESAAIHDEQHTIQLDPETGEEMVPERIAMSLNSEEELPKVQPMKRIVPYQSGNTWETRSWRFGSAELWLVRDADEPGILLQRQEEGAGEPQEIRLTSDPDAVASVTPDGSHIFILEPSGKAPLWQVFSATCERVAELPYEPGAESVAMVNGRVLYVVNEEKGGIKRRTLRCRDLQTAAELWSFQLSKERPMAPPPLRPRM